MKTEPTDPALNFLPRRYRKRVQKLLFTTYGRARENGVHLGREQALEEQKKSREGIRTELLMTIQRLGDANAQIGTQVARILEKF